MKRKILLVFLPVFMGALITAIFLSVPAKANPQAALILPNHEGQHAYGTIDSFPDGLVGEWIVSGTSYLATNETEFSEEHGPFAVGACVGVEYTPNEQDDGLLALKIQTEYSYKCTPPPPPEPVEETSGIVITFPVNLVGTWMIDSTAYTATSNTRFEQEEGPFMVGGCVEVKYITNTHEAIEIQTADNEECGGEGELDFFGFIDQVPATNTITGTWVISGVEFISTAQTELNTEHGPLVVGACAKVEYKVVEGQNLADEISSQWAFHCLGFEGFSQIYGAVVSFPPDFYGTWVISPTHDTSFMFVTDPSTRFKGEHWDIQVGTCMKVKYYTQEGVNHATELSVKVGHQCDKFEQPSLSKLIVTVGARPTDTLTGTWTLAGVPFTATQATHFEDEGDNIKVGDCIETKYDPAGGAMLLRQVEGEEAFDCQADDGSQLFKLFGYIETMPDGGVFTGTWKVSGITVEAITTTVFEQDHGVFAPGAFVGVKFTYDAGSGVRTASEIETRIAPGFGREHHFGHLEKIELGVGPNVFDQYTVDGITYLADPAIDLSQDLQVGMIVDVNAYRWNGNLFATRIVAVTPVYLPILHR